MFDYILHFFTIDWILTELPTWVPLFVIGAGVALYVAEKLLSFFIPIFYRIPIQIIAFILFGAGCYIDGRQDALINGKAEAEKIVEKIVTKQVTVTKNVVKFLEAKDANVENNYVEIQKQISTKDDDTCVIPKSFISLHNLSATAGFSQGTVPDTSTGNNGTTTETKNTTGR
jgi:hypothetical protein